MLALVRSSLPTWPWPLSRQERLYDLSENIGRNHSHVSGSLIMSASPVFLIGRVEYSCDTKAQ